MAIFRIEVNIDEITKEMTTLKKEITETVNQSVQSLASMTHAKLNELADENLVSLRQKYKNEIAFDNPEEGLWVVTLKQPAMWIEEGLESGFQEGLLHGRSSKISKDGKRYATVPFEHSKPSSEQSSKSRELSGQIKDFLKQKGISHRKIEYGADGSPRLGLLHKFDIPSAKPTSKSKDPALKGLAIYQKMTEEGSVKRSIMTFRTITEDHRGEGKWYHPGLDGKKLVDKAFDWALNEWENTILPSIMKDIK